MSIAKHKRQSKRQMGQFLTPPALARQLVDGMDFRRDDKVLEPSMGDGSFIIPLLERFMRFYRGSVKEKLAAALGNNIYGVELDESLYRKCLANIEDKWGVLPVAHNFVCGDFLLADFDNGQPTLFDHVMGNPPFGGTIDATYQDVLDKRFGFRGGLKIKKETYAFFIVKSMDLLCRGGRLTFICSDTFLTIKTMKGLRNFLFCAGDSQVEKIPFFSDEVSQQTVLLTCDKGMPSRVRVDGRMVSVDHMRVTPNYSWRINKEAAKYFCGAKIGDMMTATSGMTVGKNAYFVREVIDDQIIEPYDFVFWQKPITLADAVSCARLGHLSEARRRIISQQEARGETVRAVRVIKRKTPLIVKIPHADYCPYNKADKGIARIPLRHVIFWRDDGDAVYTYKSNGNWYLRGVGGKKYFFRGGLTWNLVASRLWLRCLPSGHVLDSGAPCAFLKSDVADDEMYFILGWGLTDLCNDILKKIINHTKNIQSKDFERLPYPFWVRHQQKLAAIELVKEMIQDGDAGKTIALDDKRMGYLNTIFSDEDYFRYGEYFHEQESMRQMPLIDNAALGIGM